MNFYRKYYFFGIFILFWGSFGDVLGIENESAEALCLVACRSHLPKYNPSKPPFQGEGLPSPYPLPTGSARPVVGTSEGVAPLQAPPRRPKTPPRRFQDDPRRLLDAPRRSKMPPRRPQDAPRHPKTLQDAPKTPPRHDFGGFGEPKPKQVGTKIVSSRDFMLK